MGRRQKLAQAAPERVKQLLRVDRMLAVGVVREFYNEMLAKGLHAHADAAVEIELLLKQRVESPPPEMKAPPSTRGHAAALSLISSIATRGEASEKRP